MNKVSLAFVIFLGFISGMNLSAQSVFHAPILYDASGPVKEIKLQSEDPLAVRKKVKYTENGRQKMSVMNYNEAGYPIGFGLQMPSMESNLKIDYNIENLVDSIRLISSFSPNEFSTLGVINSYNDKGELVHRVANRSGKKKGKESDTLYDYSFQILIFDSAGNWISRFVELDITDKTSGTTQHKEYTETRTIKYYQEDKKK